MCNNCGDNSCDTCLEVSKGDTGDRGPSGINFMNFIISGAPASNATDEYITMGEFPFDGTITDPFTALKANIYVNANTGSLRIRQKKSPNTILYENNNISSTSDVNIETAISLDIIPSVNEIVQVQIKSNDGIASCFIGSIEFYYTPTP